MPAFVSSKTPLCYGHGSLSRSEFQQTSTNMHEWQHIQLSTGSTWHRCARKLSKSPCAQCRSCPSSVKESTKQTYFRSPLATPAFRASFQKWKVQMLGVLGWSLL